MLTARTRRLSDERGLTLVELLVVIAILGIIIVPLGNAMITYFKSSTESTNLLSESHDAQIAAAYFAQDVQSVGVRDWTATAFPTKQSIEQNVDPTSGLYPCGSASLQTAMIRMAWNDPDSAATDAKVVVVSYVLVGQQLHRVQCLDTPSGGSFTSVTRSDAVIAHNVDAQPTVTCSTSCTSATVPQTVTLVLHLQTAGSNDPEFVVTLTGQRRQS